MSDDRPTLEYEHPKPPPLRNRFADLAFGRFGPSFTWLGFARDLAIGAALVTIVAAVAFAVITILRN